MGRATAPRTCLATVEAVEREPVPQELYDGIDFEELNAGISMYRRLLREGGLSAALSHSAGQPVLVVQSPEDS